MSEAELLDVQETSIRVARSTILSKEELLTVARQRAGNASSLTEDNAFFFSVDASNNSVDSYGTSMATSSLKNYAADAEEGVPFQNSHNTRQLPFGQSLAGKFTGGSSARMSADFYTVRGLNLNGVETDQLILGMETGVVREVSIGFYGGWCRCSICGKDMYDWSVGWSEMCQHWPGNEYDITSKDGTVTGREMAVGYIEDAHLSEISAVYKGACPGAVIKKTVRGVEAGVIPHDKLSILEQRYRIKVPGAEKKYAGLSLPEGTRSMTVEEEATKERQVEILIVDGEPAVVEAAAAVEVPAEDDRGVADATVQTDPPVVEEERAAVALIDVTPEPVRIDTEEATIRAALTKAGVNPGKDPNETLRNLVSEYKRLIPLAKDGEAYRADLISETLDTGVRALGNKFNRATYDNLLATASIDSIKQIRDGFAETAKEVTPIGRITKDNTENIGKSLERITAKVDKPNTVFANG